MSARTRINLSQTAKGLIQFEVTVEYPTPEESAEKLGRAIDRVREVAKAKGLRLVDEVA